MSCVWVVGQALELLKNSIRGRGRYFSCVLDTREQIVLQLFQASSSNRCNMSHRFWHNRSQLRMCVGCLVKNRLTWLVHKPVLLYICVWERETTETNAKLVQIVREKSLIPVNPVTSRLVEGIPHLNVCFCSTSSCTTPALLITWHLLLQHWPLWCRNHKVCIFTLWPEVDFYCICCSYREGIHHCETTWHAPPPHTPSSPHKQMVSLSCLLAIAVTFSFCVWDEPDDVGHLFRLY